MNARILILALTAAFCASSVPAYQHSLTNQDRQIVAMGHKEWLAKVMNQPSHTIDQLEDAERKFAWAQTLANDQTIKSSSKAAELNHLKIMIANIIKASFVIGDYMMVDSPLDHLYIAKSTSLGAISLRNILLNIPTSQKYTAKETWDLLSETRKVHQSQSSQIEAFRSRKGGYDSQRLLIEYDRMGIMMKQSFDLEVLQSNNQKQQFLEMCQRLIKLTLGKDPLPYKG